LAFEGREIERERGSWLLTCGVFVAAEDFGDFEEGGVGVGGVSEGFFGGEGGFDDVFAEDVGEAGGVGHGFDTGDVDFGEFFDVAEDGGEFLGEGGEAGLGNGEAGELGDVTDLVDVEGFSHRRASYGGRGWVARWGGVVRGGFAVGTTESTEEDREGTEKSGGLGKGLA
jgi:hypothetical protein